MMQDFANLDQTKNISDKARILQGGPLKRQGIFFSKSSQSLNPNVLD
tara:strand:- start:2884 stop:3024 length:141 start_codon:yes stop_codon:yes gene_type:complete